MCRSDIQAFINLSIHDSSNGNNYKVIDLARWVSWQSFTDGFYGYLPISLILAQWGNESSWGGVNITVYNNPGEQGGVCGFRQCGTQPNGLPAFCGIAEGVKAYSALIRQGYRHVGGAFRNSGEGANGTHVACVALGQGFEAGHSYANSFCGGPSVIDAAHPRIWDQSRYTTVNKPGSILYGLIEGNDCLYLQDFVFRDDPHLPGF